LFPDLGLELHILGRVASSYQVFCYRHQFGNLLVFLFDCRIINMSIITMTTIVFMLLNLSHQHCNELFHLRNFEVLLVLTQVERCFFSIPFIHDRSDMLLHFQVLLFHLLGEFATVLREQFVIVVPVSLEVLFY
jgi:hypothetical protein